MITFYRKYLHRFWTLLNKHCFHCTFFSTAFEGFTAFFKGTYKKQFRLCAKYVLLVADKMYYFLLLWWYLESPGNFLFPSIIRPIHIKMRDLECNTGIILMKSRRHLSKTLKSASLVRKSSITKQLNSVAVLIKILKVIKTTQNVLKNVLKPKCAQNYSWVLKNVLVDLWSKFLHNPLRKIPQSHLISWCGNFVDCSFPQNFHTRKLGLITVFYVVIPTNKCFVWLSL